MEKGNQASIDDDSPQNLTVKIPERLNFLNQNIDRESKLSLSTVISKNENKSSNNQLKLEEKISETGAEETASPEQTPTVTP